MSKETNFGVFYKCFREKEAVENSLDLLYDLYPGIPVYLVSDGGLDFSYLEKKHSGLKFTLGKDLRGWQLCPVEERKGITITQQVLENFNTDPQIHENLYRTLTDIIERFNDAVSYCKKSHVLFMEPDILVRGKLNIPGDADFLCPTPPPNIDENAAWRSVLAEINGACDVTGWSVPIIFSSRAFESLYIFSRENEEIVRKLLKSDVRVGIADDVWMPLLFGAIGIKAINNPEATECHRNPAWRNSFHPLLHGYREKYPIAGSENIGRHAR